MIQIVPCQDRLEELIHFVARLNSDGTHHIGFFGDGEADVRSSLAECLISPAHGFMLAYEANQLVGIFGVDADPEINRAWLFGPLVEHADWHTIADQLYEPVLPIIPVGIREHEMFCDVQNIRLQEFAVRHDFPVHSENALMTLNSDQYTPTKKNVVTVVRFEETFFNSFEKLHKAAFPTAYFTARQMVERIDEKRQLFLAVDQENIMGYNFCKIEPEAESGYVDFIATDTATRGRGIGNDLLTSGLDWMLSTPSINKINLTVNADNVAARSLYEKFGFVVERVMRGYRKQIVIEERSVSS